MTNPLPPLALHSFVSTSHPSPSPHLTGPEGVPDLGNDGLVGSGIRGRVKHKHKIKYECISSIFFVLNTSWASYNAVATHIPDGERELMLQDIHVHVHVHVAIENTHYMYILCA